MTSMVVPEVFLDQTLLFTVLFILLFTFFFLQVEDAVRKAHQHKKKSYDKNMQVGVSLGMSLLGARGGCVCGRVPVGG